MASHMWTVNLVICLLGSYWHVDPSVNKHQELADAL